MNKYDGIRRPEIYYHRESCHFEKWNAAARRCAERVGSRESAARYGADNALSGYDDNNAFAGNNGGYTAELNRCYAADLERVGMESNAFLPAIREEGRLGIVGENTSPQLQFGAVGVAEKNDAVCADGRRVPYLQSALESIDGTNVAGDILPSRKNSDELLRHRDSGATNTAYRGVKNSAHGWVQENKTAAMGSTDCTRHKKGSRIKSFLLRMLVSGLLVLVALFPKIYAYEGSDKVTETIKTIVMTDITHSDKVGDGKLVDIIRALFGKSQT